MPLPKRPAVKFGCPQLVVLKQKRLLIQIRVAFNPLSQLAALAWSLQNLKESPTSSPPPQILLRNNSRRLDES